MDFYVASVSDIISYLSSVMLGESLSANIVSVKNKSETSFSSVLKKPSEKERLKASVLLSSAIKLSPSSRSNSCFSLVDDLSMGDFPASSDSSSSAVSDELFPVLNYLSSVMLGHSSSSVLVNVKFDDTATSQEFFKSPSEDERLKACELLIDFYSDSISSAELPAFLSEVFCE